MMVKLECQVAVGQRQDGALIGDKTESVFSLRDVFGFSAGTKVGSFLSLIVGVNSENTFVILLSFL